MSGVDVKEHNDFEIPPVSHICSKLCILFTHEYFTPKVGVCCLFLVHDSMSVSLRSRWCLLQGTESI